MQKDSKINIEIHDVHQFIMDTLEGVMPLTTWGETAYFYNPNQALKRGTYFATIKEKDGENDQGSQIDRDGLWRLSMGVRKAIFLNSFDHTPARPSKGCTISGPWDFTQIDQITPHPVYGWMCWMAVLNPSNETFEQCKPLILDAHMRAVEKFQMRIKT